MIGFFITASVVQVNTGSNNAVIMLLPSRLFFFCGGNGNCCRRNTSHAGLKRSSYIVAPMPSIFFIIYITFLQRQHAMPAQGFQPGVNIFTGFAELSIRSVAQGQYPEFHFLQLNLRFVDMIVKLLCQQRRLSLTLGANHYKEIFFFSEVGQAVLVKTGEFYTNAFFLGNTSQLCG